MIGQSDIEVAKNIVHYRNLQTLQKVGLISQQELLHFVETRPMEFKPLPRIIGGSIRKAGEMNAIYERMDAITILAKELTGLL